MENSTPLQSIFGYLLLFLIILYSTYMVWFEPDKFRKGNYMPWMDSHITWNIFRIFMLVMFLIIILVGILGIIKIIESLLI